MTDRIEPQVTLTEAVSYLNDLLATDPVALHILVEHRVPCNDALADHPTCQVAVEQGKPQSVGLLGVLNGLFGVDSRDRGHVQTVYDEDDKLNGFVAVRQQPGTPLAGEHMRTTFRNMQIEDRVYRGIDGHVRVLLGEAGHSQGPCLLLADLDTGKVEAVDRVVFEGHRFNDDNSFTPIYEKVDAATALAGYPQLPAPVRHLLDGLCYDARIDAMEREIAYLRSQLRTERNEVPDGF